MKAGEGKSCPCHLVRQKSHVDWPVIEGGLRGQRQEINRLNHGTVPGNSLEFCLTKGIVF
jgi:hypothetical protein